MLALAFFSESRIITKIMLKSESIKAYSNPNIPNGFVVTPKFVNLSSMNLHKGVCSFVGLIQGSYRSWET